MTVLIQVQLHPDQTAAIQLPPEAAGHGRRLEALYLFVQRAAQWLHPRHPEARFYLQLLDEEPDAPCFRFDGPLAADGGGPLIPDPYALGSNGYAGIRARFASEPLPPWEERLPIAIWRGSSTGTLGLNPENLSGNRRYQLCQLSRKWPALLDARFTAVVQAADGKAQQQLEQQLHKQRLLVARLDPWHLALHRWLIEIDGNVNSWGLLWKLFSGCCVLRVASERRQWYHHRLIPWTHVVPVASDLSNLAERLQWCKANPQHCAAMAAAAQALAQEVVDAMEQDQRSAVEYYAQQWLS